MKTVFFLWSMFLGSLATGPTFLNNFDGILHFQCPAHQSISHMFSIHDNTKEDRQFSLSCTNLSADFSRYTETCYWTSYINDFDQPMAYNCPLNQYVSGMESIHSNRYEDRRWKLYCCSLATYHMEDCKFSDWANTYDHNIDYTAPTGTTMRGLVSVHDNTKEDRMYKFEYCNLRHIEEELPIVG